MILIILLTVFLFFFYYLSSFNSLKIDSKLIFITLYLICAIVLRVIILPELNKDYYGYFDLHNFEDPEDFISFLFSEPYLYLLYKFFHFFVSEKKITFILIYWFNFILTNSFFIWLATRLDLSVWKKMTLFVFYYFLFGFVLLRNAPVYILFACFIYYNYRNRKFNKILLTPFMHLSALSLIIMIFCKNKYYLKFLFIFLFVFLPFFVIYVLPLLNNFIALQNSMNKVDSYSDGLEFISVFHKIYFVFVTIVLTIAFWVYKKKAINPILVTTIVFYYISFFINPVLGFRFSPYVLMAVILFYSKEDSCNTRWNKKIDLAIFCLLPYFIYTLIDTHYL